jgi:Cu-Zn family superoxide dismutase
VARIAPLVLFLALSSPTLALAAAAGVAASISGVGGKPAGNLTLSEGPTGVLMRLELTGLTPGWHAIHFHEKADCSDAAFASAGAHINHAEAKKPHGLLNPQGPDMGDLPNVYVGADGVAHAEVFSALVSLKGTGGRPALQDADGSALVVHASPDDGVTQPIGGAGARIACAAIR